MGRGRVRNQKGREAWQVAARQARDHEHAVRRVLSLFDRGPEGVELGETATLVVRNEQPDALPAVVEPAREIRAQLVEAFAAQRRDLRRAGKAIRQASPAEGIDPVDL